MKVKLSLVFAIIMMFVFTGLAFGIASGGSVTNLTSSTSSAQPNNNKNKHHRHRHHHKHHRHKHGNRYGRANR